jgi:hypothetical protein
VSFYLVASEVKNGSVLISSSATALALRGLGFLGPGCGYGNTCHATGIRTVTVAPVAFLEFPATATGTGIIWRVGRYDGFHYASSAALNVPTNPF